MPSPAYIFRDLFTVAELQAMIIDIAQNGQITSLSGGAKSSTFDQIPVTQLLIELRAELNRLTGRGRAQKVQNRFVESGFDMGGAITE